MICAAPKHPEAQRCLTTSLASVCTQEHVCFNPVLKVVTISLNLTPGSNFQDWWSSKTKTPEWGLKVWHRVTNVTFWYHRTNRQKVDQKVRKMQLTEIQCLVNDESNHVLYMEAMKLNKLKLGIICASWLLQYNASKTVLCTLQFCYIIFRFVEDEAVIFQFQYTLNISAVMVLTN